MPDRDAASESSRPQRADKLTAVLWVSAALCATLGFGILFAMWWRARIDDPLEILRIASQQYVNGQVIVAGDLAATVEPTSLGDASLAPAEVAEQPDSLPVSGNPSERDRSDAGSSAGQGDWIRLRDFLIGAGKVAKAETESDARQRRTFLLQALPFLQAAAAAGFPTGRETAGLRILGEAMFQLGQYDDATQAWREAIQLDPAASRNLAPQLAQAELYAAETNPDKALATIEAYLTDRMLTPQQRWSAQLIRIRALIAMKQWKRAADTTAQARTETTGIQSDDPVLKDAIRRFHDDLSLLAAVRQVEQAIDRHRGRVATGSSQPLPADLLSDAIGQLEDLQREADSDLAAEARLWSARAHLVIGRREEALALYTSVRQQRPLGPHAIIGGLEEIELLARQRRGEEVLQTTRYLIRELRDRQGYQAAEVSFDEFRRRLIDALDDLRRQGDYVHAIDTARTLAPVFDPSEALIQEAIGYQQWATATNRENTNLSIKVARGVSRLARSRYRAAGDAFAAAAKLLFDTEQYLPTQWLAIEAYQNGRHFRRSIDLLKPYLRYEQRRRQPRGLVAYGRALLAEGDTDEAIQALETCIIEFPRDPLRYDARLLAALAYAENDDLDTARQLLIDNLHDGELTPQSPAWRESLFTLAELLYHRGYRNYLRADRADPTERLEILRDNQPTLEEAIRYLDQAVERYKWIPRAESAAYMAARARILAADWPRLESQSPAILEAARRAMQTRADSQLQSALQGLVQLRAHLLEREDDRGLPPSEQRMLRNCYLGEADALRELGRLEEAVEAYQSIEFRYLNEPTALEAILGRADCLRDQGRDEEANQLVRQAKVVLGRIPQEWDEQFDQLTRYDRAGWQELLDWMETRLPTGT